jgi:hypothetical protein
LEKEPNFKEALKLIKELDIKKVRFAHIVF